MRGSDNGSGGGQDFEAASCLLLTVPGETTWRSSGDGDEGKISSDVEGRSGKGIKAALLTPAQRVSIFTITHTHTHTRLVHSRTPLA